MALNWALDWKTRQEKNTELKLKDKICPKCAETYIYSPGILEEIATFPAHGNGYISLLGCKTCKNVYYRIVDGE